MSRWISTVRPSGRPLVTSRCLRSPVDAGSIPYSAVIQPRPWPIIQRGTDSCTEAVQITRVPPQAISAEPVAVRTKPGSIVTGRSSFAARPLLRVMSALLRSSRHLGKRLHERHVLHAADRQLQEPRPGRAQRLGIARGQEPVLALAVTRVR